LVSDVVIMGGDHFLLRHRHCVKEGLRRRLAEAPQSLMWPRLVVIGLQLVDEMIYLFAERDPAELVEHCLVEALADTVRLRALALGGRVIDVLNREGEFILVPFPSNGYGDLSPGKYNLQACAVTEAVLTFFFLFVIIGGISPRAPAGFAGLAIGLALTLVNLIGIPVTNCSVNPARSTGPALIAGAAYIQQLWLFWAAPIVGAFVAGLVGRGLFSETPAPAGSGAVRTSERTRER
jgi:Major intrinsic protein